MAGELLLSLSSIRTETLAHVAAFAADLEERAVPLSLLVAPRLPGGYRLAEDTATRHWLRDRRERGAAIILHGYGEAAHVRTRPTLAAIPEHEAALRLTAADRMLEQAGLRTRMFAAPRFLPSDGALRALPRTGFRLSVEATGVRDLSTGRIRRSPVVSFGEALAAASARAEPWVCRALMAATAHRARTGDSLRLSVKAEALRAPEARRTILRAVDLALACDVRPGVYPIPGQGVCARRARAARGEAVTRFRPSEPGPTDLRRA